MISHRAVGTIGLSRTAASRYPHSRRSSGRTAPVRLQSYERSISCWARLGRACEACVSRTTSPASTPTRSYSSKSASIHRFRTRTRWGSSSLSRPLRFRCRPYKRSGTWEKPAICTTTSNHSTPAGRSRTWRSPGRDAGCSRHSARGRLDWSSRSGAHHPHRPPRSGSTSPGCAAQYSAGYLRTRARSSTAHPKGRATPRERFTERYEQALGALNTPRTGDRDDDRRDREADARVHRSREPRRCRGPLRLRGSSQPTELAALGVRRARFGDSGRRNSGWGFRARSSSESLKPCASSAATSARS